ncbi:succinate dehydrogenase cytochrome b subunit [bacterium]|nr:succinate dehydrogenase cytochrome b subunit [bacterium]
MISLKKAFTSSVGLKFLMGLSGLALMGFIITHLLGNLPLYSSSPDPYNTYVQKLHSYGPLLTVAEFGLLGLFLFHIVLAIAVTIKNKASRPEDYKKLQGKGAATSTVSSRNMAISGLFLLVFLVIHIADFRFGPGMADGYTTTLHGEETRDLYKLVVEEFSEPGEVIFYVVCMIAIGFHIRHGFWSAFQSLGLTRARNTKTLQNLSTLLAVILSLGFLFIPIVIYFRG